MSGNSTIEWTNATWNPVTGCTKVTAGCDHCYAETIAKRFEGSVAFPNGFALTLHPERLQLPLTWKKPRMIFVNSMSDLFHTGVSEDYIRRVFDTMRKAHWHTFQILTKRAGRLRYFGPTLDWPANVWMGVSIELDNLVKRADALRVGAINAAVRFLSCEPLLGPLPSLNLEGIHWVIAGAESGHGARPMSEEWVRSLRDQCQLQHVAFFYKQNARNGHKIPLPELDGKVWNEFPAMIGA